jgi:hypothetical protein
MIPRKPDSGPQGERRHGRRHGHAKDEAGDHERRDDAEERRPGRRNAEVHLAVGIAMAVQRDEVQQREDRDRGDKRGQEHVAQRVVVLLVHKVLRADVLAFALGSVTWYNSESDPLAHGPVDCQPARAVRSR